VKNIFKQGDKKLFEHIVQQSDIASFKTETVHPVYATFAIARDAEWSSRLFVIEMKEENEEGIGTFVHVEHLSPAFVGDKIIFEATIIEVFKNSVECSFTATCSGRLIAKGKTGQKILPKSSIENIFKNLMNEQKRNND
jgi:predicted thioesterase